MWNCYKCIYCEHLINIRANVVLSKRRYRCRRFPPMIVDKDHRGEIVYRFPFVAPEGDGCGEGTHKPVKGRSNFLSTHIKRGTKIQDPWETLENIRG